MENMDFSSEFDTSEKGGQLNDTPNPLVSIAKNEHINVVGLERSDSLSPKVESRGEILGACEKVLPVEGNEKNVSISNSVSCNELLSKSAGDTCEILPDNEKQNQNNKTGDNYDDEKSVNSDLIGQKFNSLNIFDSHSCNEDIHSDHDSISVSSEERIEHDFLVIHRNDACALTLDSLKTCANEESAETLKDDSEDLKDKFKECWVDKGDGQVYTDVKHSSSEIKERVMSYLNKHPSPCESEIKEQECNKMLSNDSETCKKSVMDENKSVISIKEGTLSVNSSNTLMCGINVSPIKSDTITFSSSAEGIAKQDPAETSQSEFISQLSNDVASGTSSDMITFVHSLVGTDLPSHKSNKIKEKMVEGPYLNSLSQHYIGNNDMVLTNSDFEETACNTNFDASVKLNSSSMETNASEICLGEASQTGEGPKILDCSGSSSGTNHFGCEKHVSLSDTDHTKYLSDQTFSDASLINESFQPCYKSGTILTNSSLSSWGKLSFQPLTTSSINSPIFSSKCSNEEQLNSELLIGSPQFKDSRLLNLKSFATSSQDDSILRKTKSSEALFCAQILPQSYDSVFSGNITGKTSSTLNNLNFTRPPALAESSWSVNNLNKRPVLEEKISSNFAAIDSHIHCNSSFGSISASEPFKRYPENPFFKKPPESIGIFSSSQEISGTGFPTIFKSDASSATLSPKREKQSGRIAAVSDNTIKISFCETNETGLFSFSKNAEEHSDKKKNSPIFNFTNCDKSNDTKTFSFNPSQSRLVRKHVFGVHQPDDHAGSQFQVTPTPFLFQNKSEKFKGSNYHRFTRMVRKPCKQYDRGISNLFKEANVLTTLKVDIPNTPFKPAYGSDVILEKDGRSKNIMVRYQNIVFMKEHLNISPEELRVQYYHKTSVIGPFKFCASSEYSKSSSHKKTHNKEVQTDENVLSKKYELTEIWRALECPVCLDVVMPPVYQCQQGHHACLTCWNKVVTCPLCKQRKSVTRNYMAEALIDQIPLPCKYHIEGCKETVCRTNKVSHEETCSYRMYQCPVPLCNQAHSYQNMCTHFKKIHKSLLHHEGHSVGKGEKFCDVLYKDHLSSSLIHGFDIAKWGLFFLREHSKRSRALFIQVMPASPEPAAYFYHLEVSDHHDCRKECYKGRVFSMGKPLQEIIDEEEYLSLSELILKTVKKTAPLKIVVTIWQLKPAFTLI